MNGNVKFHKPTGPAFNQGERWISSCINVVYIDSVRKHNTESNHYSDYTVRYFLYNLLSGDRVFYKYPHSGETDTGVIMRKCTDDNWWVLWDSDKQEKVVNAKYINLIEPKVEVDAENIKVISKVSDCSGTIIEYKGEKYKLCKV